MSLRGTAVGQNARFTDKQAKLLRTLKFPSVYATRVDPSRVNLDVMREWVDARLVELLGIDDDIVAQMVFEYLDSPDPDPRTLHINLVGFLEDKTAAFMKDLWKKLVSAQNSPEGIPAELIDAKIKALHDQVHSEQEALRRIQPAREFRTTANEYHSLPPRPAFPRRPAGDEPPSPQQRSERPLESPPRRREQPLEASPRRRRDPRLRSRP
ncbi:hypothetical protein H9P43_008719 [Blastocladiella emersonii ATCC 22665]|nr:hypothetical protein H9P43_008719 [Blastocladiella emersonii ATCC 22665]